jgi:hypothetical protein
MTRRLPTTTTRPPPRALRPARTSAPIPSLAQVASALALGALGAAGSVMPAAAAPPPDAKTGPDGGAPVIKEETGNRDGIAVLDADGAKGRGMLVLKVEQAGAQVSIDGVKVGMSPLAGPLPLDPGQHQVVVQAPGSLAAVRTITIMPGSTVAVVVPSAETSYPPFAGVPPPTIHHGGMCACDLPGSGTDPAPLEALGAAALVALAACRTRRRKGDPAG